MGDDVTPEEPVADEAASGRPPERSEEQEATGYAEPTEADFAEAEVAAERARLAAQRMSWRRRTATGAILSGLALGFQQVFEDKKQDVSVIVETSGEPPTDLPVEAELEGLAPRRSVVKIRPWLLGEEDGEDAESSVDAAGADHEDGTEVADGDAAAPAAPDAARPEQ